MTKTLIFTATYNEKENINLLIKSITEIDDNLNILIIDDNSPDGTGELLLDLEKNLKNLKIIIREKKLGLDTAHKLAYDYAIKNQYNKLITMDADLSHDPIEIPKIIKLLDIHSFVIGSRYMGGGSADMSFFRKLLSSLGNKIIKLTLKTGCNEHTSSYRGFNINKLINFDLKIVNSKGYSFFMETIYRLNEKKFDIHEIPIFFKNRSQGKSKIPKIEILRTLKNIFLLKYFD